MQLARRPSLVLLLLPLGALLAGASPPAPQVPDSPTDCMCSFGRKYVDGVKDADGLTGVATEISTRSTSPCCEPNSKEIAASAVYVTAVRREGQPPGPLMWSQFGHTRRQPSGIQIWDKGVP